MLNQFSRTQLLWGQDGTGDVVKDLTAWEGTR